MSKPDDEKKTGGSAFPCIYTAESWSNTKEGMTLRDYFAAKALSTMREDLFASDDECRALAEQAYTIADAMLMEREK